MKNVMSGLLGGAPAEPYLHYTPLNAIIVFCLLFLALTIHPEEAHRQATTAAPVVIGTLYLRKEKVFSFHRFIEING